MTSETNRRALIAALAASGATIVRGNRLLANDATPDTHDHDENHDLENEHSGGGTLTVFGPAVPFIEPIGR